MAKLQQKRALVTREKILDALEHLLATREFEMISIADIAGEAGVAVGSVYSHFKDKDALLPGLLDRQLGRVEARVAEVRDHGTLDGEPVQRRASADLHTTIEQAVRGAYQQITTTRGIRRALLTYRRMHPDLDIPLAQTLADQAFDALVTLLNDYREDIRRKDIREAAKVVNYFINVVFIDQVVFLKPPVPDNLRPSIDTLIEAYTNMVHDYLTREDA